jgi:hypothetical protein
LDSPSTKIIQWNLPSLNKDHPMKTQQSTSNKNWPPSTKIIQWNLTLSQQRSSNENLHSLNKGWSLLMEGKFSLDDLSWGRVSFHWMIFVEGVWVLLDDICWWTGSFIGWSLLSSNEIHLPSTKIIQSNSHSLNKDHPMKTYPPSTKIMQRKLTFPQQRSSNETPRPSTNIIQFYWMIFVDGRGVSLDDLCWGRVSFHWMIFVEGVWVWLDDICWERRSFVGWSLLREGKFSLDDICCK